MEDLQGCLFLITWWRMGKSGRVMWPSEMDLESAETNTDGDREDEEQENRQNPNLRTAVELGFKKLNDGSFGTTASIISWIRSTIFHLPYQLSTQVINWIE